MACVLKRGELLPARPHSTRTGDAVTLTSSLKSTLHRPDADVNVVRVNLGTQVLADSFLPQELFEKLCAVFQIVPTYAPLPGLAVLETRRIVAGAALHPSRAACFGKRVRQGC